MANADRNRGTIIHSQLTGEQLHEPKGVAEAEENTVYFADGSGSGLWAPITADKLTLLQQVITRREQSRVDVPSAFSLVGLLAGLTGSIFDANTFSEVNKNTKEIAYKLNVALEAIVNLDRNVNALREELSELQDRLANHKFIEVK
jgi:hypothetical protein